MNKGYYSISRNSNLVLLNNKSYNIFKKELQLTDMEIDLFLIIINKGMMNLEQLSVNLGLDKSQCKKIIESLIIKNMIIEYSTNLYETFHPRFAIINRYKRLCLENRIPLQKNLLIDNLANALEKPFNAARTK
jgi:predicted transcriptional regulator